MIKLLDCTLRDGGYYNNWDFSPKLIADYLQAMQALAVDYVEIGFRSLSNKGFKGGCAFSTDSFISSLPIPVELKDKIGVMVNGSELVNHQEGLEAALKKLFSPKQNSPVTLVRIACHVHEFESALPAAIWLKEQGYLVGFNIMQIADRSPEELSRLARLASSFPIDALYFADSMGSLDPEQTSHIVRAFKQGWTGELGIHSHDNMGKALANTKRAVEEGVTWVDGTVTGMGRGAGNVKTEYLAIELADYRQDHQNITKLLEVIHEHFQTLQTQHGWGSNPYYYLAGKYSLHPSYIQEMIGDSRYSEADILAIIDYLKIEGGKKFSPSTLEAARHFYSGEPRGQWKPADLIQGRDVLILGTGPGVHLHCTALESFIRKNKPFVIALNTKKTLQDELINIRAASHPVRLLADCAEHTRLPQPLAIPASMLPEDISLALRNKTLLDFGLSVQPDQFEFHAHYAKIPTSAVVAYVLAIATSGQAKRILLAGFDGYGADDPRNREMDKLFECYSNHPDSIEFVSITPTRYQLPESSVYGQL